MKRMLTVVLLVTLPALPAHADDAQLIAPFRPPAVPLVTHDPYFSVWSTHDRLTDDWPRHWTGAIQAMCGLVRIDGKPFRFMGPQPETAPAMRQVSLEVLPTRTIYRFEAGGVQLRLTFFSPLFPDDLDILARPVSYLSWEVQSSDQNRHHVELYCDCTAEWAVNTPDQPVVWERSKVGALSVLRLGSQAQPVLEKAGDNVRIDWGYLYLAVPPQGRVTTRVAGSSAARDGFVTDGKLPAADDTQMPRAANDRWPVLACAFDLGSIGRAPVSRHLLLAYDDLYSIEYFHQSLRPYWRRNGMNADALLRRAARDYSSLVHRAAKFDAELMADLRKAGGREYAQLATLAFRQALAAHKLVAGPDGTPLFFPKENFSNGCIDTVDVIYPSSPFLLLFNPRLLEGQLTPILDYAQSARWKFPFAPHDLGTYPKANGQVYGGGENNEKDQMPVEESGNILLMIAALEQIDGNADYARKYWGTLTKWAEYLKEKGLDPENQLCTDDFAGHLAHNANLSLKAILALGSYATLCERLGKTGDAAAYRQMAGEMARTWIAKANDGDHYRLAFDKPGTWSQKYNLVWDRLLGLNLFPPQIARTEIASYQSRMNRYGLPLDNRKNYTKADWLVWTATLAESKTDFETLVAPLYRFVNESPSRVPFTDWYDTVTGKQTGFQARSVIGGVYLPLLKDDATWKRWAHRAK
ncbi:MAG: glutaminase family protein [Limisphaerales bacterium]